MKLVIVILFVLAILLVLAIKFLPWWASLLLLGVGILGMRWWTKYFLRKVFILPFKIKGQALAEATIKVHDLKPAPVPEMAADFSDDEITEYQSLRWYLLDVTILPLQQSSGFIAWQPSDLMLVPPNLKETDLLGGYCLIHDCKIFQDDHFGEDIQGKYEGFQRIQLYIGVRPGVNQLRFRYYFELFGDLDIPNQLGD